MKSVLSTCIVFSATLSVATAGTLADGDFVGWNLSSVGPGTMTLEGTGGNPGARLNATTTTIVGGPVAYDLALNANFSTTVALAGAYTLGLQIRSGPGDFGAGQSIALLVQQGSDTYLQSLGTTGSGHATFDPISFLGNFTTLPFTHLTGAGAATPNFAGGTATFFGFAAINSSNNATVTEYYDNFTLTHAAVPEPSAALLLACGACWFGLSRIASPARRSRRGQSRI